MWSSFARRLRYLALGTALASCGGDLTLPGDDPPPGEGAPTEDPPSASLLVFSGDGQQARIGKRLDDPLVVRLTVSSSPLAGVPVEFGFQGSVPDAEVDPTTATTDEDGLARAEVRLGTIAGLHTVEARVVQPSNLVATFGVTALEKAGRGGRGGGGGGGGDDDEDDDEDDDGDDDDD